jgi:hypothetical protein
MEDRLQDGWVVAPAALVSRARRSAQLVAWMEPAGPATSAGPVGSIRLRELEIRRSRTCECIPIPVPTTSLILLVSCSRGALHEASGVGQDAAPGDVPRKHAPGRPWVSVRPVRVCHCELAGRGQASGAKSPCSRTSSGVCQVPGRTDQGFKTPRWNVGRRSAASVFRQSGEHAAVNCYQGAPFGVPPPPLTIGGEVP